MYVFVYGSLKMGGYNHHYLQDSKFIEHFDLPGYSLHDTGYGFPCIVKDKLESVWGEIYKIDQETLFKLDRLEGEGSLYFRKKLHMSIDNKMEKVYFYIGREMSFVMLIGYGYQKSIGAK